MFHTNLEVVNVDKNLEMISKTHKYITTFKIKVTVSDYITINDGEIAYCWLDNKVYPGLFERSLSDTFINCDIEHPNVAGPANIYAGLNQILS